MPPPPDAAATSPLARPHIRYLDGLRGFAALFVACSHLFGRATNGEMPHTLLLKLWSKIAPMSHFAVSAFIILSGYCLVLPLFKSRLSFVDGIPNYFARRFARIAPAFYAAFLLSVLLATQTHDLGNNTVTPAQPVTATMTAAHLFFLQTVIPHGLLPYNGVLWSVGVEWWIYFSLPALLLLWRRTDKPAFVTACAVALFYVLFYLVRGTPFAGFRFEYFALFAIGAFCAHIAHQNPPKNIKPHLYLVVSVTAFVATFGSIALIGWKRGEHFSHWFDLLFGIYFCAMLLFLAKSPEHPLTRFWSHPWLVALGTFSYSLYLIHFPLQTVFVERVMPFFPANEYVFLLVSILICLPLVCVLSYGFYRIVEEPSLRWSQSLKKKTPTPVATTPIL